MTITAALVAAGGAQAQNATAQNPGPTSSPQQQLPNADELQTVVVTATRRQENIQSVPISVTAFTKAQMDVQGIKSIDDIARLSPSIQFNRGGGVASTLETTISIRGMGAIAGPATTGVYIDDTPIQVGAITTSGSFTDTAYPQLFDIQRVEVLNGPHGTLFGSGSEGGAVRFITTPPNMEKASMYVRSEVSNTEYGAPSYEIGIAGGAPIIADKLGFRASVWTRRDGGYIDHVDWYTGQVENPNNNDQQSESARIAFGWKPIDNLTITPSFFFQHIHANGSNAIWLRGDGITGSLPGGPPLPVVQQPWGDAANGDYVDLLSLNEWGDQRLALPALKINWELPHAMELFSNTSYFQRVENSMVDYSPLESANWGGMLFPPNPTWTFPGPEPQGNRYFVQELRLQSTDANARLKWLVGAFFSHDVSTAGLYVWDPYLGQLLSLGPYGCGTPLACYESFFGNTPSYYGPDYTATYSTKLTEKQKALYTQEDLRLVGGLTLTVGLRYAKFDTDWLNYEGGPVQGTPWPGPGGQPERGTSSASVVTPKYMVSYKTTHTLTYLSATKGFRNGGVNPAVDLTACKADLAKLGLTKAPLSYNPDSVWSYELGSKWTLLNDRLLIDAAVYQYDWSNMINEQQLSTCTLSFTTNIGKAQGRGFELTVKYRPIDPLTLSMNAGYDYLKAIETIRATSGAIETQSGDTLTGSSTINAAVQYAFTVAQRPGYFRVDYSYQGRQPLASSLTNPNDASYVNQPDLIFQNVGYSVLDARLGMFFGGWDISLFSDNLLNSQPLLGKTRDAVTFLRVPTSVVEATTIRPRTSGVTAIYRF